MQVTRTTINAWMISNFRQIPSMTAELAALDERLKMQYMYIHVLV